VSWTCHIRQKKIAGSCGSACSCFDSEAYILYKRRSSALPATFPVSDAQTPFWSEVITLQQVAPYVAVNHLCSSLVRADKRFRSLLMTMPIPIVAPVKAPQMQPDPDPPPKPVARWMISSGISGLKWFFSVHKTASAQFIFFDLNSCSASFSICNRISSCFLVFFLNPNM